jgi:hypothetical protein
MSEKTCEHEWVETEVLPAYECRHCGTSRTDAEAVRTTELQVQVLALEERLTKFWEFAELLQTAKAFAEMSSLTRPAPDAAWSIGHWHEGRFVAVIKLEPGTLERAAALVTK